MSSRGSRVDSFSLSFPKKTKYFRHNKLEEDCFILPVAIGEYRIRFTCLGFVDFVIALVSIMY